MAPPAPTVPEETTTTHTTTSLPLSSMAPTAPATTAVIPTPSTSAQAQELAALILQSSLSQQPLIPPPNTSAQANIDFLRELCFPTLSSGNLLSTSATNDIMVALTRQPVATVINVTNNSSGAAPILHNNNNHIQHPPSTCSSITEMPTSTVMLPCRARGMPQDHQFAQAHFVVPPNIQHGDELVCSYPACRDAGVKFCFCTHCRIPVAKRNFRIRHNHCDFVPPLAIVGNHYELSPQMKRTTNGVLVVRPSVQAKKQQPAAAAAVVVAATSISASDTNSDPMTSRISIPPPHDVAPNKYNNKRKRHSRTMTLAIPPNTLGGKSYCAQSSATMLQEGGNDRLVNNNNSREQQLLGHDPRLGMAWASLLGERPPKK